MTGNLGSTLRHRVTLQQPVMTPDGAGGFTRTWSDVADLWAQIEPVSQRASGSGGAARELADGHLEPITTHRVTLRYTSAIGAGMRLLYNERILNIISIINVNEANTMLQILAKEGTGG